MLWTLVKKGQHMGESSGGKGRKAEAAHATDDMLADAQADAPPDLPTKAAAKASAKVLAKVLADAPATTKRDALGLVADTPAIKHADYAAHLRLLQIELVKLQRHIIAKRQQVLVIVEGRDAAGKDGCIKRVVQNLSPRESRVVALGKPSDRQEQQWYFQRYVAQLPADGELVLFNRSWYNRAGVEQVMGFCSRDQYQAFLQSVPHFESMLIESGLHLIKVYLDIGRDEQVRRLDERTRDPLKQWKVSPIDAVAVKHWKAYSAARDTMFLRTHSPVSPWFIVRADDKRLARLNLIRLILSRLHYRGKKHSLATPDPGLVFGFTPECLADARLAR